MGRHIKSCLVNLWERRVETWLQKNDKESPQRIIYRTWCISTNKGEDLYERQTDGSTWQGGQVSGATVSRQASYILAEEGSGNDSYWPTVPEPCIPRLMAVLSSCEQIITNQVVKSGWNWGSSVASQESLLLNSSTYSLYVFLHTQQIQNLIMVPASMRHGNFCSNHHKHLLSKLTICDLFGSMRGLSFPGEWVLGD